MSSYEEVIGALKAQASEADEKSYFANCKKLTWQERGSLVNYLNSVVYNYDENHPPRLDKTAFSIRKQIDEPTLIYHA